ncbi:MAG TPA: amidase, partial [Chloroflexota bacterium]|nr:amidase [Chloroflexota bacterium]
RCVPFALGSETWGSIVTPASYCGVSGLRPTYGRVSRHGAMALSWTLDKIGPLCRSADDCGLVLGAIAGADPADPTTISARYRYSNERDRVTGFRLGVLREGLDVMQPEVKNNFEIALRVLREVATCEEVTLPDYPYAEIATLVIRAEGAAAMEELAERNDFAALTAPEDRIGAYAGSAVPAVDYLRAQRIRRHASIALDALFARYDAVVAPSTGLVASPLTRRFDEYNGKLRRLMLGAAGNIAGLPGISVPNGYGERGLPTGLQFVGRAGSENRILAVSRVYQERSTWHRERPAIAAQTHSAGTS